MSRHPVRKQSESSRVHSLWINRKHFDRLRAPYIVRCSYVIAAPTPAAQPVKGPSCQVSTHRGKRVARVGDDVNDAPALPTTDGGSTIGSDTTRAGAAGDVGPGGR